MVSFSSPIPHKLTYLRPGADAFKRPKRTEEAETAQESGFHHNQDNTQANYSKRQSEPERHIAGTSRAHIFKESCESRETCKGAKGCT
jgi:hypothetical protein